DVPRAHDLLLDEALTAAERALGLAGRGRVGGLEVVCAGAGAESATATAVDGLDDDREADALGDLRRFGQIGHGPIGTGCDGSVDGLGPGAGVWFVAGQFDRGRRRPDPGPS